MGITSTYAEHAKNTPDKIAIQTYNQKINYLDWHEQVGKTAKWFHSLPSTNKTIGIYLPNGIPFLQLFAGASAAGWIAVPFDLKWKETELQNRINLFSPSMLITTRDMYHKLRRIYPNVMLWEDCLKEIKQKCFTESVMIDGDLPFYMGFTSGSTGNPKAFIRSHTSWVESFQCNRVDLQIDEFDHVLIPGAMIHSHFLYGAISTLFLGGTVYVLEKFSPTQTLSFMHTYPISVVYLVPTMIEALLKEDDLIERPVKMVSSGAKWEDDSKRRMRKKFPYLSLYELFGASELSFITVLTDQQHKQKPESVGKPCLNVDIQIRHSNQQIARPNEIGKIYVKSNMMFMGYLHANHQALQSIEDENGWITVDDMGYLDEDGYLYISGRENHMILYGGINIFPEEIETILSSHKNVDMVAVVGIVDSYWGQMITAVVKGSASKKELRGLCREKLASYKVPRKWYFVEEMPLISSGKIDRVQIKDMIERKLVRL